MPFRVSGPTANNAEYDPSGYGYTVEVPAGGGGRVYIFDAGFCGMPVNGSGRAGTGDEWTGNLGGTNPQPVSTYFNLYDQNGSPFLLTDDILVWNSGSRFENMKQTDKSGLLGSGQPQYDTDATVTRCDRSTDANYQYHLKWWQLPITLPTGNYRLQVTTTKMVTASGGGTVVLDPNVNANVGAANRFGLEVTSSAGNPRIYGSSRMAAYANVQSGRQTFYLAQIDRASGAGKTVEIDLYDPGDVGGGRGWRSSTRTAASTTPRPSCSPASPSTAWPASQGRTRAASRPTTARRSREGCRPTARRARTGAAAT